MTDQQTLPERVRALLAASEREYQRSQTGTEEEAYYNGQGAAFQAVLDLLASSQEPSLDAERLARAMERATNWLTFDIPDPDKSDSHLSRPVTAADHLESATAIAAEYDRLR